VRTTGRAFSYSPTIFRLKVAAAKAKASLRDRATRKLSKNIPVEAIRMGWRRMGGKMKWRGGGGG
jgi:hypothetical protein